MKRAPFLLWCSLVVILDVGCTPGVFAQPMSEPGFIVLNTGDTLRGTITLRRGEQNPKSLDFAKDGSPRTYRPLEVVYFQFGDKAAYVGVAAEIDQSPMTLKDFSEPNVREESRLDTVFLSVIVRGKLSLYSLVDRRGNKHYFAGKDGQVSELHYRLRLLHRQYSSRTLELNLYREELKGLIQQCPQAEPLIDRVEHSQRSLQQLFMIYNERCHPEVESKVNTPLRPTLVVSIFGGGTFAVLDNGQSSGTGPAIATYRGTQKPAGGLYLEVQAHKMLRRLSVINEFLYYSVDFVSTSSIQYRYNLDYLRYNLAGRMYFSGGSVRPFLQAGAGIGKATRVSYFSGTGPSVFVPTNKDRGVFVAVGTKWKRLGMQVRYERGTGFSDAVGFRARVNSYMAFVSVDLNKLKE